MKPTIQTIKTYTELQKLSSFEERYEYLRLQSEVGEPTFGFDRYLNQTLYRSRQWKQTRDQIIYRDNGCDLGVPGYEISGLIVIHHMNPITPDDIEKLSACVFDPEGLICVTHKTHLAIHFGNKYLLDSAPVVRYSGDTTPWRK